jgi:hypothetical protein
MALFVGYRDAMRWDQADVWLVPYYTISFLRSFILPSRLGGTRPGFVPSGSLSSKIKERGPSLSGFVARFRALVLQQMVWIHVLYIMACTLGFLLDLFRCFGVVAYIGTAYSADLLLSSHNPWVFLLTRIGWPPMWWMGQLISCWIPVSYILWPPTEVSRDEALQTVGTAGVQYPKEEYSRPRRTMFGRPSDHFTLSVFLYTVVVFVESFYV